MSVTYTLTQSDRITDSTAHDLLLCDLPHPDNWRTESLVASGDYCEMLAAALEQIAVALPTACVEQYQIQDAIGQLLYIQRHYQLVKRSDARKHSNR